MTEKFAGTMPSAGAPPHRPGGARVLPARAHAAFHGPISLELFKGGQSNPTYKLITAERTYAMRTKPGPADKLLASAHAIEREFRVLSALARTEVPVAEVHVLCEDEAVIGRAFYLMEFVDGRVLWEQGLPGFDAGERAAIYDEMNRVIAALHSVDYAAIGLADFGKPGNYFARQIGRWSRQYQASETEKIAEMDQLIAWLPAHIPPDDETTIVHGDYRLDNLMFAHDEPRILAILDWELSTLGHPLADFSYHCMSWHIPPDSFAASRVWISTALGIPDEAAYVQAYCRRTGRDVASLMRPLGFLPGLQHVPAGGDPAGDRAPGGRRHRVQRHGPGDGGTRAAARGERLALRTTRRLIRRHRTRDRFEGEPAMDFDYSPRVQEMRSRLLAFMDEHIYPNERHFHDEIDANRRAGNAWIPTKIVEELKPARARRGCGTCSCRAQARARGAVQPRVRAAVRNHGPRVRGAPEVFNCSAPDTGNMEMLVRYGSEEQQGASGSSRCSRARSARLRDDRARRGLVRRHQHPVAHRARRRRLRDQRAQVVDLRRR